ncbi:MAG TPA: DUF748 domain-containing protein, partial [Ideonella sp.]|nr:DUF748 domain-containing protein [Ideonella sp.]
MDGAAPRSPRQRLWRVLAWTLGVLALLALAWTLGIGWWLPRFLQPRLEAEGSAALGAPLKIERIEIAPWKLDARMLGLRLGPPEAPWLRVAEVRGIVALESLRRLAPVLERVQVREPQFDLERLDAKRWNITPLLEALAKRPPAPEPQRFALHNIELDGGRIRVVDRVTRTEHRVDGLRIGVPFLSNLPSQVAVDVLPLLDATVDGSRLHLQGRTQPFSAEQRSAIDIRWQALDVPRWVAGLAPLLAQPLPLGVHKGTLDLSLSVAFERRPAPALPSLHLTGSGTVTQLQASMPAQHLQLGWERLAVEGIDLRPLERQAAVGSVAVQAPAVEFDVARLLETTPEPAPRAPAAPASAASAADWQWRVGKVTLAGGRVRLVHPAWPEGQQVLAPLQATLTGIDGRRDAPAAQLDATFADAHGATVKFAGTLGAASQRASLKAEVAGVDAVPWLAPWAGTLPVRVAAGRLALRAEADVEPAGWSVSDAAIQVDGLQIEPPTAAKGEAKRRVARSGAEPADRLALRRLDAGGITLRGPREGRPLVAHVASLRLDGLDLKAAREERGALAWLPTAAPGADKGAAKTPPAASPTAPRWQLDELRCSGCAFAFADRSVKPATALTLSRAELRLAKLSDDLHAPVAFELAAQAGRSGSIKARGEARPQPLALKSRLDIAALDLGWLQPYIDPLVNITLAQAKAGAAGELRVDGSAREAVSAARWRGRLALTDVRALDKTNGVLLARWRNLSLDGADVAWRPGATDADLGAIALNDFSGRVIINPDGRLNLRDVVKGEREAARSVTTPAAPAASAPAAPASAASAPDTSTTHLRWRGIRRAGGQVDFTDNFIRPNYSARLTDIAGDIAALAWNDPQPAAVHVSGKVDGSAPLEITGSVNPLGARLYTDLTASARGIDITRLSGYAARYAGYGIEKGTLSARVHYKVENGKLEAQNNLVLDQLTFGEKVDSPDALKLPVLLAVSLLKDRHGVINVDLPISGSLDDPQFSLGGIIVRVIVNLITKAVTAPFTLLAHAFGGGDQQLGWVEFAPGSAQLDKAATERLDTLAKALEDRPALKLEVTGRADPAVDVPALRQRHVDRLVRVAKARAEGESPARVTVEPAERARWLEAAYKDADLKDKPRNVIG